MREREGRFKGRSVLSTVWRNRMPQGKARALVGHSLGGVIWISYALKFPDTLRRLIRSGHAARLAPLPSKGVFLADRPPQAAIREVQPDQLGAWTALTDTRT